MIVARTGNIEVDVETSGNVVLHVMIGAQVHKVDVTDIEGFRDALATAKTYAEIANSIELRTPTPEPPPGAWSSTPVGPTMFTHPVISVECKFCGNVGNALACAGRAIHACPACRSNNLVLLGTDTWVGPPQEGL